MAIQTTTNAITINPNALQRIRTVCHTFTTNQLRNKHKHRITVLHNMATLVLVPINLTMAAMYRNRITLDLQRSLCKEWCPVNR